MYSLPTLQSQDRADVAVATDYHTETAERGQDRAISTYRVTESVISAALQSELARRIEAIMNYRPSPETIFANPVTLTATFSHDGSLFRLEGARSVATLVLVRPCAYCGTGEFSSIPLTDLADLGYALTVWEPLHADCQEADPANWLYS
ncbi:MAG TPA: hypothetical protein VJ183_17045 [Chloroflexia bacterium]|nr:hypothetical protein [Chloroflexia bacterium]